MEKEEIIDFVDESSEDFHYAVMTGDTWQERRNDDVAGIKGAPITKFLAYGVEKYRVLSSGKWSGYATDGNEVGSGDPIERIEIIADGLVGSAHLSGGEWLGISRSDDGVMVLGLSSPIDMIWITR